VATEVGQNQMWTAQWFTFRKPETIISSGGLGTMGYGFPAAIGGRHRLPGKSRVGHRGRRQHPDEHTELATAVGQKVPVKVAHIE